MVLTTNEASNIIVLGIVISVLPISEQKAKLKLNIFEIKEDLWSIKLQDCREVDNYASRIDRKVIDYYLCAGHQPRTLMLPTPMEIQKIVAKISEHEHIFNLIHRIPRNNRWNAIRELVMDRNTTMTAMPDVIITKLVQKVAGIKRGNGLTPEAVLFAKRVAKPVKPVKAAKVKRGIREIIRETKIGKRRIGGNAFIASGEGISPNTA